MVNSQPLPAPVPRFWLFSASVDLSVFLGSALVSLLALGVGAYIGVLHDDTPEWAWVPAVLLIDVAHVYATGFRVYFDAEEMRRKPLLYALVPVMGFAIGVALYSEGAQVFWRGLAYLAVFHFVRQQYGWVALYRARLAEHDTPGQWIDMAAIYAATLYPLIHWHTHLPRRFWWFVPDDFSALSGFVEQLATPLYWFIMGMYGLRSGTHWLVHHTGNPGKDMVVLTTAVCWYVGIVTLNSDYAFTVTNVVMHGVPYFALIYWGTQQRVENIRPQDTTRHVAPGIVGFVLTLWLLAYLEELVWDRGVWHERAWLFGGSWDASAFHFLLVPLLAVPQITHYVLDGFIWRRKNNPGFTLVNEKDG